MEWRTLRHTHSSNSRSLKWEPELSALVCPPTKPTNYVLDSPSADCWFWRDRRHLSLKHSRVKFEKINIWKSQHFMLKFKIISSYEQICTCSSWFSFLSKQTISRPKYFDHWKRSLKLYFFCICSFLKAHSWLGIFMLFSLVKC